MKKPRSQIAIIITFVIAAIILFIAVFINIYKVSTIKTSSSQGADRAALSLASQLGSMSYYYKYKVLENNSLPDGTPGKCSNALIALAIIAAASILAFFIKVPPTVILTAGGLAGTAGALISMTMLGSIQDKFNAMTIYNGAREAALFEALGSLQSDDVSLLPKGSGIFYDDANNNGSFDAGEPEYDLGPIAGMLNQKKVGRFSAWYYAKRLPLVLETDETLKNKTITFITDLKDLVNDVGVWEAGNKDALKLKELSYTIPPGTGLANFEITKDTSWADSANKRIRIVSIEEDKKDEKTIYETRGGFLQKKLISLATRLKAAGYDLTFYTDAGNNEILGLLIPDLTTFLSRIKELLDMPRSPRLKNVMQWLPLFYDSVKHAADRTSKDGNLEYDIYLRLTQDQNHINTWITELETKDALIRDIIDNPNGHNEYGLGGVVDTCNTKYYCCSSDCVTWCCDTPGNCSFAGVYCSACGGKDPPVCVNGDLYGKIPNWCPLGSRSVSCSSCDSCSIDPQCPPGACPFQGQLAYNNTSGPTEVEQAIRILRALNADITDIKKIIGDFAEAVDALLAEVPPSAPPDLRNKIVYAWKDAPGEGTSQLSHLVSVEISGYPEPKKLPKIGEKIEWLPPKKCLVLQNPTGSFLLATSRYDQDIPLPQWTLRRRKHGLIPEGGEFPPVALANIVDDIQDNGKIDTTGTYVDSLFSYDYPITSQTEGHYGPEKSDIYIKKVK